MPAEGGSGGNLGRYEDSVVGLTGTDSVGV